MPWSVILCFTLFLVALFVMGDITTGAAIAAPIVEVGGFI